MEDIVALIVEVVYLAVFGSNWFVALNLAFTLLMITYDIIAKVLRYGEGGGGGVSGQGVATH